MHNPFHFFYIYKKFLCNSMHHKIYRYLFSKQYRKTWEKILFAFFFSNSNISICKKSTVGKSTFPCQNSSTYIENNYLIFLLCTTYNQLLEKYDAKCFYFFFFFFVKYCKILQTWKDDCNQNHNMLLSISKT